uniref:MLO-like protein n=1 Tax=Leersia perrieri TaxID=77586 RepID=A0A0D9WS24_9ORYZ
MKEESIAHTPTWVVAVVCFVISLKHNQQKTLYSALERVKEELMLLGFISFVLSLSQGFIVNICISENATRSMLPCKKESYRHAEEGARICKKKGEVPLLSLEALHQLHIFIFVLGLVHVVFCATTILLGGAKIRRWKHWENGIHREMQHKLRQIDDTPMHVVRNHQGEFVSERTKGFCMKLAVVSWIIAFLKQFHNSVSKSDYIALRSAFGLRHYPKHPFFDFHKYMVRALEHDFKRVVGIRMAHLLLLLLVVGAKLEHIITRLAQEAAASLADGTEGVPIMKPSKEHFWFCRPEIVLHLIHFILFQNSFEIGFFFWVLVTYGFDSCIMEKKVYAITRLMDGGIKLQGIGSGVEESVTGWITDAKKKGRSDLSLLTAPAWRYNPAAGATIAGDTEVEVTRARDGNERFGGSPPPDLHEIVAVAVADDNRQHRR